MTAIYREDGTLRQFFGYDSESYLLNNNLASPRVVCGTFASNAFPPEVRRLIEDAGPERGLVRDIQGMTVALVDADLYVTCMTVALSLAWTSRHDGDDALMLVAHNAAYDIATHLQRARLQELMGTTERDWSQAAQALGLPEDAPYELVLHSMWLQVMDLDGTGFPTSESNLIDTSIREKLIRIAAGEEPERETSLAACVKKYLGEDRSDDKKGPPCPTCVTKKKVVETFPGCSRRVCSHHNQPQGGEVDDPCVGTFNGGETCGRALKLRSRKVECSTCGGRGHLIPWRLRYSELDGIPLNEWPKPAIDYAIEDAIDGVLVAVGQAGAWGLEDFDPEGIVAVVDRTGGVTNEAFQVRANWSLKLAHMSGPRSEREMYEEYVRVSEEHAAEALRIGQEMGFVRKNGTRDTKVHQQLVADAYERLGREAPLTQTGRVKTDDDTVRQSGDERLIAYQEHKEKDYTKVIALGLEHALAADPGVLKATGRTSWKMYMHQPPRKGVFRECWVPRDGNLFLSCDWTAAEMVALAQILTSLYGESAMRDAINAGQDLHLKLGVEIWNADPRNVADQLDYAEFERRYKASDKSVKLIRQFAKIGNFGFPGGLKSLVDYARGYGIIIDEETSDRIRQAWMRVWFNMPAYLDQMSESDQEAGGYGFTYVQWVSGRVRGRVRYTVACNTGFQGLVADAMKLAMWWTVREMYTPIWNGWDQKDVSYPHSPGGPFEPRDVTVRVPSLQGPSPLYGSRAWLWIHDEGLLEVPEQGAPDAAARLSDLMVNALSYFTPDVSTAADPALMRRWYKDAEPIYDAAGVLIPWEPT